MSQCVGGTLAVLMGTASITEHLDLGCGLGADTGTQNTKATEHQGRGCISPILGDSIESKVGEREWGLSAGAGAGAGPLRPSS
jgi:hypothetical protein